MERIYKAYSRTIEGETFFFVKQYLTFPEYQDAVPILETYGMNANFKKACNIALIHDKEIQSILLKDLGISESVANGEPSRAAIYSFTKRAMHVVPSVLKLIRLR